MLIIHTYVYIYIQILDGLSFQLNVICNLLSLNKWNTLYNQQNHVQLPLMMSEFMTVQIAYILKIIYAHVVYKCNQNLPATSGLALSLGHLGKSLISKAFIFQLFIDDCVETVLHRHRQTRSALLSASSSLPWLEAMQNVVCNKSLGLVGAQLQLDCGLQQRQCLCRK